MGFKGSFRQWEHLLRVAIKGLGDGTASTETLSRLKKAKPEISETSGFFCGCDEPAFGGKC
jgi:hypothetical protein